jgi:RsiW-degrading membrane proteinase PrsW (M82 family)
VTGAPEMLTTSAEQPTMSTPPAERLPDLTVLFPFRAWLRHPALRTWTTWLFVALVAVPPAALALFRNAEATQATVFSVYFAAAWFLVLWVVVRPQKVGGALLAQVVGLAVVVEPALAIALEEFFDPDTASLGQSILAVGVPEELAKMVPVAFLLMVHRRRGLVPRDALFLGAVSGLAFGMVEAIRYTAGGDSDALEVVWRLVTDPISHALWAGVAGYFLGLACHYRTARPWFALAGVGLGVPAVLHGLNDWAPINGNVFWVVVQVVSALLFLAYARIGLVAAPPAPRPVPIAAPQMWGPPATVTASPAASFPRTSSAPAAPSVPAPRTSGRHAAVDDPVTAPIALTPAMR